MDNPIPHAVSLLFQLALLLLAIVASVVACGRLIRSKAGRAVPVPLLTATVWLVPCALLWMARLPWFHNARDARDLGLIVPVAFVLGGLFGLCFMLRSRWGKASAGWAQRTWVGAAFGLVLALLIGVLVHNVLTGWGGPGGGGFQRPGVFEVTFFLSWLSPAFAVAGLLTPEPALVRVRS